MRMNSENRVMIYQLNGNVLHRHLVGYEIYPPEVVMQWSYLQLSTGVHSYLNQYAQIQPFTLK